MFTHRKRLLASTAVAAPRSAAARIARSRVSFVWRCRSNRPGPPTRSSSPGMASARCPTWKPITWTEEQLAKGVIWIGSDLPREFFLYGTPGFGELEIEQRIEKYEAIRQWA